MHKENKSLRARADEILSDIESGEALPEELEDRVGEFSGYSIESLRSNFVDLVVDMRDYGEADQDDWNALFKSIPSSRHATLILRPSEITRSELELWALPEDATAYESFCFAAGIPLTNDPSGPIAVIGTQGDVHEYSVFLVAESRKDAELLWSEGWIS